MSANTVPDFRAAPPAAIHLEKLGPLTCRGTGRVTGST